MATLGDLARQNTLLEKEDIVHLQNLISEWGMLADFCFADLLLYLPTSDGKWIIGAHVRAATGQTLYIADRVATWAAQDEELLLAQAFSTGEWSEGEIPI